MPNQPDNQQTAKALIDKLIVNLEYAYQQEMEKAKLGEKPQSFYQVMEATKYQESMDEVFRLLKQDSHNREIEKLKDRARQLRAHFKPEGEINEQYTAVLKRKQAIYDLKARIETSLNAINDSNLALEAAIKEKQIGNIEASLEQHQLSVAENSQRIDDELANIQSTSPKANSYRQQIQETLALIQNISTQLVKDAQELMEHVKKAKPADALHVDTTLGQETSTPARRGSLHLHNPSQPRQTARRASADTRITNTISAPVARSHSPYAQPRTVSPARDMQIADKAGENPQFSAAFREIVQGASQRAAQLQGPSRQTPTGSETKTDDTTAVFDKKDCETLSEALTGAVKSISKNLLVNQFNEKLDQLEKYGTSAINALSQNDIRTAKDNLIAFTACASKPRGGWFNFFKAPFGETRTAKALYQSLQANQEGGSLIEKLGFDSIESLKQQAYDYAHPKPSAPSVEATTNGLN